MKTSIKKQILAIITILSFVASNICAAIITPTFEINFPRTVFNINVQNSLESKIMSAKLFNNGDFTSPFAESVEDNDGNLSITTALTITESIYLYDLTLVMYGPKVNGKSNPLFMSKNVIVDAREYVGKNLTLSFDLFPTAEKEVTYTLNSEYVLPNESIVFNFMDGTSITQTINSNKSATFLLNDHNPIVSVSSIDNILIGHVVYKDPYLFTLLTEDTFEVSLTPIDFNASTGIVDGTEVIYDTGIRFSKYTGNEIVDKKQEEPFPIVVQPGDYNVTFKDIEGNSVQFAGYLVKDGLTEVITNGSQVVISSDVKSLIIQAEPDFPLANDADLKLEVKSPHF